MNPTETETLPVATKRRPGRPRKNPIPIEPKPDEAVIGHHSNMENLNPVPESPDSPQPMVQRKQTLGDLYSAIDDAPDEWFPSLLAKVVRRSLKKGVWSSVENLILSVRGFTK